MEITSEQGRDWRQKGVGGQRRKGALGAETDREDYGGRGFKE